MSDKNIKTDVLDSNQVDIFPGMYGNSAIRTCQLDQDKLQYIPDVYLRNPILDYICPQEFIGIDLSNPLNSVGSENLVAARLIVIANNFSISVKQALSLFDIWMNSILSKYFNDCVTSNIPVALSNNYGSININDIKSYIDGIILPINIKTEIAHSLTVKAIYNMYGNCSSHYYLCSDPEYFAKINCAEFVNICKSIEDNLFTLLTNFGVMAGNYEESLYLNMKAAKLDSNKNKLF